MEKAQEFRCLSNGERWQKLKKLELIKNLTKLEAQLSAIHLPAYGGLYRRADANHLRCQDIDPSNSFCVGPSCDRSFNSSTDQAANSTHPDIEVDQGPWSTISDYGISIAKRELSRISSSRLKGGPRFIKGSIEEQSRLLQITMNLMQIMDSNSMLAQSKLAKAYEVATFLENRLAHNAMDIPRVLREIFIRCSEVSEVGAVPLRECLIEIFQNWSSLGFTGQCPYSFSNEEINTHEREFAAYQAWDEVQQLALECLDTDADGWVAPQLDIVEKRRQNRELLSMYIERMAGEKSASEVRAMWPFPEDE